MVTAQSSEGGIFLAVISTLLSSEVGTVASLLSLMLTAWVLFSIRRLRSHFMFTARLPQLLDEIGRNTAAVEKGIAQQEEWADVVDIEMVRCRANLKSLSGKVKGQTRRSVNKLGSEIETYLSTERSKSTARSIFTSLNGLVQELRNLHEDTKWSD